MSTVDCPYCDTENDICTDDGYGMTEGDKHHHQCYSCGNNFVFMTTFSVEHDAFKADCLNDGDVDHDYRITHTYPVFLCKMRCVNCGTERNPTSDELDKEIKRREAL